MERDAAGRTAEGHLILAIGSGPVAEKAQGWVYLDVRDAEGVDVVQDAARLPQFEDDWFQRVFARDVVEHFPWREVPDVLGEWLRVAAETVTVQTPDATQLVGILTGRDQHGTRSANEPDWRYFNRVLFGHQDYSENTHRSYFTPLWLTGLFYDAGAAHVRQVEADAPWSFRLEASKH